MCNLRDIVKYKTPMSGSDNWGIIVEVLNVESSIYEECNGIKLYRVEPLIDKALGYEFIEERSISESYSKYFNKEEE